MKNNIYRKLIWLFVAISIFVFASFSLGNDNIKASSKARGSTDYQNQVSRIDNTVFKQKDKSSSRSLVDVVNDGGFEMGAGSGAWNEFSSNFGTPLCDAGCGTGGGTGPNTGSWWAWFGGTTAQETGSVDQQVTIPPGTANLSFYLEIPIGATIGFMKVIMDSDTLMTVTQADTQTYATYSQVSMDVSTYADGSSHNLKFFSTTDAGNDVTNFFVDDVVLDVVTDIGDKITVIPSNFELKQNYPNPFNPATTIAYQLPGNTHVVLKIYNFAGQEVKSLVNGRQSAGSQEVVWDGIDDKGNQVASGIYMYRLRAGNYMQTKKMTLLK